MAGSVADSSSHYQPDNDIPPQDDEPRLPSYQLDEVVVTAVRFSPRVSDSPSSVSVLGTGRILTGAMTTLAEGLSTVPGVFVKDYGGASGLKTISQRGLGAEHSLIMINGMRVSSFQNGLVDLGMYPIADVQGIEVVRGGYSAVYGSEAIGGVVNVLTHRPAAPSSVGVETSFGSFGYQRLRASGGVKWNGGGIHAGVGSERGREDYPFVFHNGPQSVSLKRENVDFHALFGTLDASCFLSASNSLAMYLRGYTSNRGVGGPVVSTTGTGTARQDDEDLLAQISFLSATGDRTSVAVNAQTHYATQRYRDPELRIGQSDGLDTYFRNVDHRMTAETELVGGKNLGMIVGGEGSVTRADGKSIMSHVERWQGAAYLSARYTALQDILFLSDVTIHPSVRFDSFAGSAPAWSPSVGMVMTFRELTPGSGSRIVPHLRATASRNFRLPTFNELYYHGGGGLGNPSLKPERSIGYDIGGGVVASAFGQHRLEVTYFDNEMTDRIVWVPAGAQGVTPRNIREVGSNGLEVSWSWQDPARRIMLETSYSSIDARKTAEEEEESGTVNKQLIFVPMETASAALTLSFPLGLAGISAVDGTLLYEFVGMRYTSEDNTSYLPGYDLADLSILLHWGTDPARFTTKLEIRNLFNSDYEALPGYPMPLRGVRLTLGAGI